MQDNIEQLIKDILEKVLFFIGVVASVDVVKEIAAEGDEDSYLVNLSGNDLGLVIGYHGEVLTALQSVLGQMVSKKVGHWVPLVVDVNSYRKEREDKIKEMTVNTIDKVRFMAKPMELPPMVAFERRLAHLEVSKHEDMESESIGDGYNRRVVIKPKNA